MTVLKLHALQLCFHFDLTRFRSAKVCEVNQSHAYIYIYVYVCVYVYTLFIYFYTHQHISKTY